MSGHSKWSSIKHKKGAADAKRGKIFSRLSKELTVVAKQGGGDPTMNPRLRTVIANAKAANMPADNIDRAIKKGTGELPGVVYEELSYEGYAPGGVAILIETLTDNKNRTTAEVRTIFNRNNGNLAANGSVSWQFHRLGQFTFPAGSIEEDKLLEIALEAGADDLENTGDSMVVSTSLDAFSAVAEAFEKAELSPETQEIAWVPENTVEITDEKTARQVLRLLELLEDHDDVQNVSSNLDIPDELMAQISEEE
jgi:YebC/PmpR family DNA-binding regulatory protein